MGAMVRSSPLIPPHHSSHLLAHRVINAEVRQHKSERGTSSSSSSPPAPRSYHPPLPRPSDIQCDACLNPLSFPPHNAHPHIIRTRKDRGASYHRCIRYITLPNQDRSQGWRCRRGLSSSLFISCICIYLVNGVASHKLRDVPKRILRICQKNTRQCGTVWMQCDGQERFQEKNSNN